MKISSVAEQCQDLLSSNGRLSRAIPGFISRQPQSELAEAIAEAIADRSILIAEAGTGTGKTFAYLLPGLIANQKMLISTATKTLQDQLVNKDLPLLVNALGLSLRVQNLKGRANYICHYRVELHMQEAHFQTPKAAHEISYIHERLGRLIQGDRAELPEIAEDSPVWPYVTSTRENCLGSECPHYQTCFLMKARKRALEANVVVINHHLFFADSRLKEGGFGEILPGMDVIIFDEAHQLAETAINFHAERFGTRQFRDVMDDLLREWPIMDLANQPLKAMSHQLDMILDQLQLAFTQTEDRVAWVTLIHNTAFQKAFLQWNEMGNALLELLTEETVNSMPGLKSCRERLEAIKGSFVQFHENNTNKILWVERFKHSLQFHATPFDIAGTFRELVENRPSSWIFTSATLTMNESFDCFTKPLGLEKGKTMLLPSPFDFQKQAILYLPRSLPDPRSDDYYPALMTRVIPVIEACRGRCFFLFTSHKALNRVAQLLSNVLQYPLLVQGEESKLVLLNRFRQLGNAVLLGTSTFWEGVDVKGEALSCVIIDKLPFESPGDPVVKGKMTWYQNQGFSAFDEYSLPNAVLALKQGVGRLIRDVTDKGVLVIADPRMTARDYGQLILSSLPQMRKTREERVVLDFIANMALENETIGV